MDRAYGRGVVRDQGHWREHRGPVTFDAVFVEDRRNVPRERHRIFGLARSRYREPHDQSRCNPAPRKPISPPGWKEEL